MYIMSFLIFLVMDVIAFAVLLVLIALVPVMLVVVVLETLIVEAIHGCCNLWKAYGHRGRAAERTQDGSEVPL